MCRVYGYWGVNVGSDRRIDIAALVCGAELKVITYSLAAALLANVPQPGFAQERPAAFVDAAAVVPGLIVDARYAGSHNFVGRPIAGYVAAALPTDPTCGRGACRGGARPRAARPRA